jgi:hypothetical protein
MVFPKVQKITIENFGGNGYVALNENENINYNSCFITEKIETPFSGSKIDMNSEYLVLDNEYVTKFFVVSISTIGLYVFYRLLSK